LGVQPEYTKFMNWDELDGLASKSRVLSREICYQLGKCHHQIVRIKPFSNSTQLGSETLITLAAQGPAMAGKIHALSLLIGENPQAFHRISGYLIESAGNRRKAFWEVKGPTEFVATRNSAAPLIFQQSNLSKVILSGLFDTMGFISKKVTEVQEALGYQMD